MYTAAGRSNIMEEEQRLPAGFRFFPTDEELVTYYLARKAMDSTFTCTAIRDVDLYRSDPWDLPCNSSAASSTRGGGDGGGGGECYFFCTRSSKYPSGARVRRATAGGYWKSTGKDKGVYASSGGGGGLVGAKKTLVFYSGRAPRGQKTSWVMHEYSRAPYAGNYLIKGAQSEWVICRVFMRKTPSDQYCNRLEMEQEAPETTTSQEHTPNRHHLLPAEAPPPLSGPGPRWQTSCRSGGCLAIDYGHREEEDDHVMVGEDQSLVVSSSCGSASSWLVKNDQLHTFHRHHLDASSDDLPELMELGDIYGFWPDRSALKDGGGGGTGHRADQSSNSVCSLLDDEPYCWNF